MAFSPVSKGWIKKYHNLIVKGEINTQIELPPSSSVDNSLHLLFSKSGIVFGHVIKPIFKKEIVLEKWTEEEKLKVLLFEALLLVYQNSGKNIQTDFDAFIDQLYAFYKLQGRESEKRISTLFSKESRSEWIEKILAKRVDVKVNLLENSIWINYLSNSFVYLDVILFKEFIENDSALIFDYDDYAFNAIIAIILGAYADGVIFEKERNIFQAFLASANLDEDYRTIILEKFKNGAEFSDFSKPILKNVTFKRFLLDIAALTIHATHLVSDTEKEFLRDLSSFLEISDDQIHESYILVQNFVFQNNDYITYLQDNHSYEKMFNSISNKWLKILGRNKDKLTKELKDNKDLVFLITKSTTTELTKKEKEKIKEEFLDLVKSVPALAIFMLPGGLVILPIILKVLPKLVPSAFRNNEIEN